MSRLSGFQVKRQMPQESIDNRSFLKMYSGPKDRFNFQRFPKLRVFWPNSRVTRDSTTALWFSISILSFSRDILTKLRV